VNAYIGPAGKVTDTLTTSPGASGSADAFNTTHAVKLFCALAGPVTRTLRGGPVDTCTSALEAG
jgi:hypothetical protein